MTNPHEAYQQPLATVVVNVAAYKFVPLTGLPARRRHLRQLCETLGLKGTILISGEGLNLFVAGSQDAVQALIDDLRRDPLLSDLATKTSCSSYQPFQRMLVKIKAEMIAFGVEGIDPAGRPTPRLSASELRRWLDEGRPLVLLDIRNDYEVRLGTFHGAVALGIDHFRQFPRAVKRLPAEYKQRPVVAFCTGGIRCEKAGPLLTREGFGEVYQLEGGILKYFESCGDKYFDGECFVFDQRVALDAELQESQTTQCYSCQAPVTVEDQASPQYVSGVSCPRCYRTADDQLAEILVRRQAQLRPYHEQPPGRTAYDNRRPIFIGADDEGRPLLDVLAKKFPFVSCRDWLLRMDEGLLTLNGQAVPPEHVVRSFQTLIGAWLQVALEWNTKPVVRLD